MMELRAGRDQLPYRITLATGQEVLPSVAVIDADGFVGRGNRLTFQQLPSPDRSRLEGIRRITTLYLSDLERVEWLDDLTVE